MKVPTKVPEIGFYYHYKHDPAGPVNNYAYQVIGVGCHTEDNCRPQDQNMVVYRPLYPDAFVYKAGKLFDLRPLDMWMGQVQKGGVLVPRFSKITDETVILEFEEMKKQMYS